MRKTKIVCTIGPACADEETLTGLCQAGMNVARLNFSHGTHEEHRQKIELIKRVREKLGLPIAIMLDTKGPEYRIRTFKTGRSRSGRGIPSPLPPGRRRAMSTTSPSAMPVWPMTSSAATGCW